jgi:hypothetical protein
MEQISFEKLPARDLRGNQAINTFFVPSGDPLADDRVLLASSPGTVCITRRGLRIARPDVAAFTSASRQEVH